VGLTFALIILIELFQYQFSTNAALGLLALAVVFTANRGGPGVGLASAALAGVYMAHVIHAGHGEPAVTSPLVRSLLIVAALAGVAAIVGQLRVRLDRVVREAARDRASSAVQLEGALQDVARAQSEVRLQARLLDEVGQAVVATDSGGRVVYSNQAACALFGREAAAMRGRPVTEVAPVPDPATAGDDTLERIGGNAAWVGEAIVRTADGPAVPVLVTDTPLLDGAGRPAGMVRVLTDLSSRRKAERSQRILADAGAVLSASLDYGSTLRNLLDVLVPELADACMIDLLGESGMAERLDARHIDTHKEELARELRHRYPVDLGSVHPLAEVMRTGRSWLMREITDSAMRDVARDEEHLRVLRSLGYRTGMIVPLRTGGRTFGALSLFRSEGPHRYDELDLRLAEELARRAATAIEHARLYEQAVLANRSKSDFLAVMSHELRTPLTTIIGYSDLMIGGVPEPIGERGVGYVRRVRTAADHLLGLIDQILIYARLELGRIDTQAEPVSAVDIVREVAGLVEPIAEESGLVFTVNVPQPFLIETDIGKVRQVLLNLLTNAIKFTERGSVEMGAAQNGEEVLFTVRDTGAGIAPENLEHIFDAFWQVDQSSTRHAGGTGLGLSVSRRLARLLGGDILVESEVGRGSTFTVHLPSHWKSRESSALRLRGHAAAAETRTVPALDRATDSF
jgi:PAS domain S-box-containing protein